MAKRGKIVPIEISAILFFHRDPVIKGWIMLSMQWPSLNKTNYPIHWMIIYPVDSAIHLMKNQAQIKVAETNQGKNVVFAL